MPGALAPVGSIGVQLLVFVCFSIQLFLAVESSSSLHLCIHLIFMSSKMLHWWVTYPSRVLNKCLVYTTAKLRRGLWTHEIGLSPLRRCFCYGLLFLSLYVFACISWWFLLLLFWIAVCQFWERNCTFGFLLVVFWCSCCFKCVLIYL